jgi:hypothetical protein
MVIAENGLLGDEAELVFEWSILRHRTLAVVDASAVTMIDVCCR